MPKTLLPIHKEALIGQHLRQMHEAGISEVFVVIGHMGEMIRDYIRSHPFPGLKVIFVEQEEQAGIAHALAQLEDHVEGSMLVYLGDIYFEVTGLRQMIQRVEEGQVDSLLSVRHESDPEMIRKNFTVELDGLGLVKRVVEKPDVPVNDLKGCGLYLFSRNVFEAIRQTPRSQLRNEFEITDSIQTLIDGAERVGIVENIDWDINLTFDADLLECNLRTLRQSGELNLVGRDCEIHPEARLERCVLGDGVRITCPVVLTDSLILSDTVVEREMRAEQVIVAPGQVIQVSIDL